MEWPGGVCEASRQLRRAPRSAIPAYETDPIWSPDSRELVFGRVGRTGSIDVFRTGLQRGAEAVPLLESQWSDFPGEWAPDGETVLFARGGAAPARLSTWALPLVDDTPPSLS